MSGGSKSQTVGYKYYMGLHFGLCHGPVDSIGEIRCGDRIAWAGTVLANQSIDIDAPNLFGGDEREGGVVGSADIMFGEPDQTANSYLTAKISALMPAFRGIIGVVFKGGQISSNNPYIKPWSFKLARIKAGWSDDAGGLWYPEMADVWTADRSMWRYRETNKFVVSYTWFSWPSLDIDGNIARTTFSSLAAAISYVFIKMNLGWGSVWGDRSLTFGPYVVVLPGSIQMWDNYYMRWAITYTGTSGFAFDPDEYTEAAFDAAEEFVDADFEPIGYDNVGADMNPAHIIYQCLTDPEWGMGYPAALIDDDAFTDAADALAAEGFGLSMIWNQQTKIGDFIKVVLDHIGAVLYADPKTGKFVLKLIREDYDAETLEVFDESNIAALESFQRAGYGETVNEITVVYVDKATDKDTAITVQDLANIQAQGSVVSQTRQYPGIRSATLAARVAERDLIAGSTPLAKARIRVNRNAWSQAPGGVVKLSWPKLGIDELICRVLAVNYGTLTDGAIIIELAEDVFGLPESSYVQQQPGEWEEPNNAPAEATLRVVTEAGYYELQQSMGAADLAALADDAGFLSTAAARPSSDALDYGIQTDSGSGYGESGRGDFCPTGTLVDAIGHTDTAITLEDIVDGDLVSTGTWAQLGNEIVRIDAWNATTGAATIGRGVLDTVAAAHAIGTRLYFLDGFAASDNVERIDAETLDVKLLPKTGTGELALADATADTVTFDQRMFRPYPPGQMEINGVAYPATLVDPLSLTIAWAHRDRLAQNLEGDETGNIGPEAGTTYSVEVENLDTSTVIFTATGISGTSQVVSPHPVGVFDMAVRLWSVRDGLQSRQRHDYTLEYSLSVTGDYWTGILADSPRAYWRLEETSGTAAAEETGTYGNGTITGGVTLNQTGLIDQGTCFDFNGTTGWIDCPSIGTMTFPITVEAWVRIDTLSAERAIFHSHGTTNYYGVWLTVLTTGAISMNYGNGVSASSTGRRSFASAAGVIATNTLYHVAAVWVNTTTCKVYINGSLVTVNYSSGTAVALSTASGTPRIGRANTAYMDGRIDEVAIYPVELNTTQITTHYLLGVTS